MNLNFLDFEQPIAELEAKIEELRRVGDGSEVVQLVLLEVGYTVART